MFCYSSIYLSIYLFKAQSSYKVFEVVLNKNDLLVKLTFFFPDHKIIQAY